MARCPAHQDRTPSLSISEDRDRLLVHCFAGCSQGTVLEALRARGLWQGSIGESVSFGAASRKPENTDDDRTRAALRVWRSAEPAGGTLVEAY